MAWGADGGQVVKDKMLNAVLEQDSFVAAFTGERYRLAHDVEGGGEKAGGVDGQADRPRGPLGELTATVEERIAWIPKLLARGLEFVWLSW